MGMRPGKRPEPVGPGLEAVRPKNSLRMESSDPAEVDGDPERRKGNPGNRSRLGLGKKFRFRLAWIPVQGV